MEVLEHVDNPASFLSHCAELLKVGLRVQRFMPIDDVPELIARRPSLPFNHITHATLLLPHYFYGGEYSAKSYPRHTYLR